MDRYVLLVVGRTQSLAEHLQVALDAEQYLIRWVASTSQALQLDLCPSLLVVDLPLSGGARCVARLKRRFEVPLLALLQQGQSVPAHVDAFVPRPFEAKQLVREIQASLMAGVPHVVQAAGMSLDVRTRRLQAKGVLCQLPPIGCQILALLMERVGEVVPREELFQRIWHTEDGDNTRVLDVHIAALRRKLEQDPRHPEFIVTERGVGYCLHSPK